MAVRRSSRARKQVDMIDHGSDDDNNDMKQNDNDSDNDDDKQKQYESATRRRSQRIKQADKVVSDDEQDNADTTDNITTIVTNDMPAPPKRKPRSKQSSSKVATSRQQQQQGRTGDVAVIEGDEQSIRDDTLMSILYKKIILSNAATKQIAREWLDNYNNENTMNHAKTELYNLLLQLCGSTINITEEAILSTNLVQVVRHSEENIRTPIVNSTIQRKRDKRIESRMNDYWLKMISLSATQNVIYNDDLLDYIIQILSSCSTSQIRMFRHNSTQQSIFIIQTLCSLYIELHKQYNILKQQINNVSNNNQRKIIQTDINKTNKKINIIVDKIKHLYDLVFVHRYRDIDPVIRNLSIDNLSHCIIHCPVIFLNDQYLKYIGWSLYDKNDTVRYTAMNCIKNLLNNLSTDEINNKLMMFINRFRDRINEMIYDKNTRITVCTIDTLILLLQYNILNETDAKELPCLLFDKEYDIQVAACKFVFEDTFSDTEQNMNKTINQKYDDIIQLINIYDKYYINKNINNDTIQDIKLYYNTAEYYTSIDILCKLFIDKLQIFNDISIFFKFLTDKKNITDIQQIYVLSVIYSIVKYYVDIEQSQKDNETNDNKSSDVILYVISNINTLISQYQNDTQQLNILLHIINIIEPNKYNIYRKKTEYNQLLKYISNIYNKHIGNNILNQITIFLYKYSQDTYTYYKDTQKVINEVYNKHDINSIIDNINDNQNNEHKIILNKYLTLYQCNNYNSNIDTKILQTSIINYKLDSKSNISINIYNILLQLEYYTLVYLWSTNNATDLTEILYNCISNYIDTIPRTVNYEIIDLLYKQITDIFTMFNNMNSTHKIDNQQFNDLSVLYNKIYQNLMSGKYMNQRIKNNTNTNIEQTDILHNLQLFALRGAIKVILYNIDINNRQTTHFQLACYVTVQYTKVCNIY